jgi:hypothetical protein
VLLSTRRCPKYSRDVETLGVLRLTVSGASRQRILHTRDSVVKRGNRRTPGFFSEASGDLRQIGQAHDMVRSGALFSQPGDRQRRGAFRGGGTNLFFRASFSAFWCEGIRKSEFTSSNFRPQPHLHRRTFSVIFIPPKKQPPGNWLTRRGALDSCVPYSAGPGQARYESCLTMSSRPPRMRSSAARTSRRRARSSRSASRFRAPATV